MKRKISASWERTTDKKPCTTVAWNEKLNLC